MAWAVKDQKVSKFEQFVDWQKELAKHTGSRPFFFSRCAKGFKPGH